jgi:dipeptidyl aminopeptidase/acylaminoacyl peptidase
MLGLLPEDVGLLVAASDPRLSPDGDRIVFTVQRVDLEHNRYRTRVWMTETDGAKPPAPITPDDCNANLARWSPDGTQLAYASKPVEDEEAPTEVRVVAASGGEPRTLASTRESVRELEWAPDGRHLAYVARDPDPDVYGPEGEHRKDKDMPPRRITTLFSRLDSVGWLDDRPSRVFIVSADGAAPPRAITDGPYDAGGISWSPDSARIAFVSARHETRDLDWAFDIFVADGASGVLHRITQTGPEYGLPSFSPDGDRLACTRLPTPTETPWHGRIAVLSSTGDEEILTANLDRSAAPYPPMRAPIWDGDALLFPLENAGYVQLWRLHTRGAHAPEPVIDDNRSLGGFDYRAGKLAFVAMTPTTLPEVYVRTGEEEIQLTDLTGELGSRGRKLAAPQRFVATAPDGAQVECWILEPEHEPGVKVPVILNVHGGPFTQYGDHFFDEFQYQVGAGFGVVFCNPRGSSGYSEAWGRAIRWPECKTDPGSGWGGVDYDDVMACVDEAVARFDWIDADHIGVMGGSYGGYMTSWIIGHTDRFAAAISERAVNNILSLEFTSDVAGAFSAYIGPRHTEDPEPYLRQSPMRFVEAMRTPLFIIHSENDLRCPISQAEELFVALRLLGRTPEFVRFPGESHELSRSGAPRHRETRARLILDFMGRHLR